MLGHSLLTPTMTTDPTGSTVRYDAPDDYE
jgi:hypothetical protein